MRGDRPDIDGRSGALERAGPGRWGGTVSSTPLDCSPLSPTRTALPSTPRRDRRRAIVAGWPSRPGARAPRSLRCRPAVRRRLREPGSAGRGSPTSRCGRARTRRPAAAEHRLPRRRPDRSPPPACPAGPGRSTRRAAQTGAELADSHDRRYGEQPAQPPMTPPQRRGRPVLRARIPRHAASFAVSEPATCRAPTYLLRCIV